MAGATKIGLIAPIVSAHSTAIGVSSGSTTALSAGASLGLAKGACISFWVACSIAGGVVIGALAIIGIVYICYRCRRSKKTGKGKAEVEKDPIVITQKQLKKEDVSEVEHVETKDQTVNQITNNSITNIPKTENILDPNRVKQLLEEKLKRGHKGDVNIKSITNKEDRGKIEKLVYEKLRIIEEKERKVEEERIIVRDEKIRVENERLKVEAERIKFEEEKKIMMETSNNNNQELFKNIAEKNRELIEKNEKLVEKNKELVLRDNINDDEKQELKDKNKKLMEQLREMKESIARNRMNSHFVLTRRVDSIFSKGSEGNQVNSERTKSVQLLSNSLSS